MNIAQVNYAYASDIRDPERLLDAYATLTGWSGAVSAAGAAVRVVQAFHRDATLLRNGVEYVFCAERRPTDHRTTGWRMPRSLKAQVLTAVPDVVHVNSLEFAAETWLLRHAL